MKVFITFFFVTILFSVAAGNADSPALPLTTVNLRLKEATPTEAYEAWGKQSGMPVTLNGMAPKPLINLDLKDAPFWSAFASLFAQCPVGLGSNSRVLTVNHLSRSGILSLYTTDNMSFGLTALKIQRQDATGSSDPTSSALEGYIQLFYGVDPAQHLQRMTISVSELVDSQGTVIATGGEKITMGKRGPLSILSLPLPKLTVVPESMDIHLTAEVHLLGEVSKKYERGDVLLADLPATIQMGQGAVTLDLKERRQDGWYYLIVQCPSLSVEPEIRANLGPMLKTGSREHSLHHLETLNNYEGKQGVFEVYRGLVVPDEPIEGVSFTKWNLPEITRIEVVFPNINIPDFQVAKSQTYAEQLKGMPPDTHLPLSQLPTKTITYALDDVPVKLALEEISKATGAVLDTSRIRSDRHISLNGAYSLWEALDRVARAGGMEPDRSIQVEDQPRQMSSSPARFGPISLDLVRVEHRVEIRLSATKGEGKARLSFPIEFLADFSAPIAGLDLYHTACIIDGQALPTDSTRPINVRFRVSDITLERSLKATAVDKLVFELDVVLGEALKEVIVESLYKPQEVELEHGIRLQVRPLSERSIRIALNYDEGKAQVLSIGSWLRNQKALLLDGDGNEVRVSTISYPTGASISMDKPDLGKLILRWPVNPKRYRGEVVFKNIPLPESMH